MTENELLKDQPKKLYKLSNLLNEGIVTFDDLADIVPGTMHINSRKDLAIEYISKAGIDIIRYSMEELNTMGAEVFKKHQSEYTQTVIHKKIFEELGKNDPNHVIPFFQDWYYSKNERPVFHFTTTKILNDDQTISISLYPKQIENFSKRVDSIFGINLVFEKYFNVYRTLTKREKEILKLLGQDMTRKELSYSLCITEKTVKKHCENVFRKIGTSKRTELQKIAMAFSTV